MSTRAGRPCPLGFCGLETFLALQEFWTHPESRRINHGAHNRKGWEAFEEEQQSMGPEGTQAARVAARESAEGIPPLGRDERGRASQRTQRMM